MNGLQGAIKASPAQFWFWAGCVVTDTQVTERIPAPRWVEQFLMGCFPEAWCSDSLTSSLLPDWEPEIFIFWEDADHQCPSQSYIQNTSFEFNFVLDLQFTFEKRERIPHLVIFFVLQAIMSRCKLLWSMEQTNSVLTLHPFCCEDLLFSSPFGPFYFFPCLTYFYEREFFYWPPFCWVPSPSTKSLLVAFLQPFCVCLETFIHFHPCILSQAQHLLPCSGPSLLVMI